jgi:hypothetical protein
MKQPSWGREAGSNQAGWEGRKQLGRGGGQGSSQAEGGESRKQKAGINQVGGRGEGEQSQVGEGRRVGELGVGRAWGRGRSGSRPAGGGKDEATRLEQRSREQPGRVFPMNFMIRM